MEKYFVTYAQSLALKELGFDMPCFTFYSSKGELQIGLLDIKRGYLLEDLGKGILAPLKSQVFEWFREKYNLEQYIEKGWSQILDRYEYRFHFRKSKEIGVWGQTGYWAKVGGDFKTHEEAESACIDELIKIVQNNLDN